MSENLLERKPIMNDCIEWKEKEELGYIFNERNGLIYTLNGMALSIWKMCDGNHTILEIASQLMKTFNLKENDAKDETVKLLNGLIAEGVVRCKE
jgi:hypothetical protein